MMMKIDDDDENVSRKQQLTTPYLQVTAHPDIDLLG
jgi:hypothetical protein